MPVATFKLAVINNGALHAYMLHMLTRRCQCIANMTAQLLGLFSIGCHRYAG